MQVPVGDNDVSSLSRLGRHRRFRWLDQAYKPDGCRFRVYGMTETSSVHDGYPDAAPGRLGGRAAYSRTRVVKVDGEGRLLGDCEPNEIGVVAMAGPGVFSGYLSDTHNRGAFVEPGWVNSGDLGRIDELGQLWITGRAKDLIIRGGHNIDPAPLEELLYRHPAVALAALVGQPDRMRASCR